MAQEKKEFDEYRLKQTKIAIVAMAASQVLHEALDELEDAPFYKHRLKQVSNQFEKEITKVCDPYIAQLWDNDEEIIRMIQGGIQEACELLARTDPAEITILIHTLKEK